MRKLILIVGIGCILAALVLVQRSTSTPLPAPSPTPTPGPLPETADPTITWSIPQLMQTIFPGASSTAAISFQSNQNLAGVNVWVTPSLDGVVSTSPVSFGSIVANQPYQIMLT